MDLIAPVPVAVGAYLAYLALVVVLWRVGKVRYDRLVESRRSILVGIVVPIGLGLVLLVAATSALGWWDEVLTQERRGPAWALAVPVIFGLAGLATLLRADLRHPKARLIPWILLGVLLVGASEELLNRGLLVVGTELAGWSLLLVWLFSSVLFGLLHGINGFFGLPWSGVGVQILLAFLGGTALFVSLLATGSLVVCVLLHALWDLGALSCSATERAPKPLQLGLVGLAYLSGIVAVLPVVLS
jgi:membrane protease YdiL (CAAX protease family)